MGQINYSAAEINQRFRDSKITEEGGLAFRMVNKTGVASVKGSVVTASTTVENGVVLQATEFDAIGVIYDDGIADGEDVWVVKDGVAEVLLADGTDSTMGNWVISAAADGRADATQPAPPTASTASENLLHFKEIGHCIQTKTAGTNVLAKITLHFN